MPERMQEETLRLSALQYHENPKPGKLEIRPTKPVTTGRDLALAYSPGVAEACKEIHQDAMNAARYTAKGNLVAVVSNGTAVLGLGNIGALAAKPVMEGKAVLFKKFANLDCFDLEIAEEDPEKLAELVIKLEPSFGAINLEDIKAPDCFLVEKMCRDRMSIPVFHDDQHGTAIVVAAATINALKITGKRIEDIRIVTLGAGAAGIACLNMLVLLGARPENIMLVDRRGIVKTSSPDLAREKHRFARETELETLEDALKGADYFLGLSGPNLVSPEMIKTMADQPMVFALANPVPEILPEDVMSVAPNALISTGRSDYPNQVNNVLCFPFIFRGALDVGATCINDEMKRACAVALAGLARITTTEEVGRFYDDETLTFGPEYLIPKPFDPRLMPCVATAVARAAIETGVATRPRDIDEYASYLESQVYKSHMVMRPIVDVVRSEQRRVVFAEGEDTRVLHTVQTLREESRGIPIVVGRPEVVQNRIDKAGLSIVAERDFEVVNPESDERFPDYWSTYHEILKRRGVTPYLARAIVRTNTTVIAALMVQRGEADSMICGTVGQYLWHLRYVTQLLADEGREPVGSMSLITFDTGTLFIADTHIHSDPTPEELAGTVIAAARHVKRFGIEPQIAICSDSQFGNLESPSGKLARAALAILDEDTLDFAYEGEMNTDTALNPHIRESILPGSRLQGKANTLIYTSTVGAGAARNLLKSIVPGVEVGPILMGMGNRAHIVTPAITARGMLNISSLALMPVDSYG